MLIFYGHDFDLDCIDLLDDINWVDQDHDQEYQEYMNQLVAVRRRPR